MKKLIFLLLCILTLGLTAQNPVTLCAGTTKASQPCKMKVSIAGTYCRFHNPNSIHCAGLKKDGTPCKMQVSKPGEYCHYHSPK